MYDMYGVICTGPAQSQLSSTQPNSACASWTFSTPLIPADLEAVGTAGIFVAKACVSSALSGDSTEADASAK